MNRVISLNAPPKVTNNEPFELELTIETDSPGLSMNLEVEPQGYFTIKRDEVPLPHAPTRTTFKIEAMITRHAAMPYCILTGRLGRSKSSDQVEVL